MPRGELFVATKVWTQGREAGIAQMRDSMKKLKVDNEVRADGRGT